MVAVPGSACKRVWPVSSSHRVLQCSGTRPRGGPAGAPARLAPSACRVWRTGMCGLHADTVLSAAVHDCACFLSGHDERD